MLKVKILEYTPNGEKLIASASKLCYSDVGIDEIQEDLTPENTDKFLNMLMSIGHASPIEHVSFTFAVEGISRVLSHQLVRHRLASFSQQSQRYVGLENFEYIIPQQIEDNKRAKEIFIKTMEQDKKAYNDIVNELTYHKILESDKYENFCKIVADYSGIDDGDGNWCFTIAYKDMINEEDESMFKEYIHMFKENFKTESSRIEKQVIEDARYVFPNACETKLVFTMNIRSLLHFINLRACTRAQNEIRELAIEILKQVKPIYPTLFRTAGPGCVSGKCPEGKMSCGKQLKMKEKFNKL